MDFIGPILSLLCSGLCCVFFLAVIGGAIWFFLKGSKTEDVLDGIGNTAAAGPGIAAPGPDISIPAASGKQPVVAQSADADEPLIRSSFASDEDDVKTVVVSQKMAERVQAEVEAATVAARKSGATIIAFDEDEDDA